MQHAPAYAQDGGGGEEGLCLTEALSPALSAHATPFSEPPPLFTPSDSIMQSWQSTSMAGVGAAASAEDEVFTLRLRVESPWTHTPLFTLSQCCTPPPPDAWARASPSMVDLLPASLRSELA